MARKKIKKEDIIKEQVETTKAGGRKTTTDFFEQKPKPSGRGFTGTQKRDIFIESPATVQGFGGAGQAEVDRFRKAFPGGDVDKELGILTPELARTLPPSERPPGVLAPGVPQPQELAGQVGVIPQPLGVEQDPLSYAQAVKSGLASAIPGVAGGAVVGGAVGAPVGGIGAVPGAIGGAVAGGVSAFLAGFRGNLKTQRKDMLAGESSNIRKIESNMLKHIMNVDRGGNPSEWLEMFNEQLSLADESHSRLKLETSDDLSLWLGEDGHTQLEKFQTFNSPGGMRETLIRQMEEAIVKPNPNRVYSIDSSVPE